MKFNKSIRRVNLINIVTYNWKDLFSDVVKPDSKKWFIYHDRKNNMIVKDNKIISTLLIPLIIYETAYNNIQK